MDTIKKGHTYLKYCLVTCYLFSILWIVIFFIYQYIFFLYLTLVCLCIMGLMYFMLQKIQKKQLQYLIHSSDAIIEQRPIHVIDGEGDISLLSHKLYTLYKRYHVLMNTMTQEQIKLKDYIEDISHQLKTPITSMRINEELLLEVIQDDRQREKLKLIYQQTLKMNRLVNDLLTLALLDSNSIHFEYHDEKIEFLIEEVEENLDYLLSSQNMQIQLSHHHEKISCDHKWFVEVLENIVKNCVEKNHDSVIDILVEDYESMIKITIQDHGQGFYKEDIEHIFERFYRSQKDTGTGIGIGLSLAKEIIEKHHGMIKAYNQQGAVFEIILPKFLAKKKL